MEKKKKRERQRWRRRRRRKGWRKEKSGREGGRSGDAGRGTAVVATPVGYVRY